MGKKKKKGEGVTEKDHFMKGKLQLCFENDLVLVLNPKYLDSGAWSGDFCCPTWGKEKKIKRKKEILRMVEKGLQQNRMPQRPKLHGRRPVMPE